MPIAYPADLYRAVHAGTPGDVLFYERECAAAQRVLEVACGDGRVAAQLSAPVIYGLDLDPELLALAPHGPGRTWLEADMRNFVLPEAFDRIIAPHSSMFCLASDEDWRRCLDCIVRHLAPGGAFAFDVWAADDFHENNRPEDEEDDALTLIGMVDARGQTWEVGERSSWDRGAQQLRSEYVHRADDGQVVVGVIEQRYRLADEISALLTKSGFRSIQFSGGFGGEVYDADSDLLVVQALV